MLCLTGTSCLQAVSSPGFQPSFWQWSFNWRLRGHWHSWHAMPWTLPRPPNLPRCGIWGLLSPKSFMVGLLCCRGFRTYEKPKLAPPLKVEVQVQGEVQGAAGPELPRSLFKLNLHWHWARHGMRFLWECRSHFAAWSFSANSGRGGSLQEGKQLGGATASADSKSPAEFAKKKQRCGGGSALFLLWFTGLAGAAGKGGKGQARVSRKHGLSGPQVIKPHQVPWAPKTMKKGFMLKPKNP